jgi:HKD family nuclease
MKPGIYDALVTNGLLEAIANGQTDGQVAVLHDVDEADQPEVLARHVGDAVLRVLGSTRDEGKRVALVNELLQRLAEHTDALPDGKPRQLYALRPPARPGMTSYGEGRPSTPLSDAALLTNAHGEPSLGPELRAEIDTSDEVDLICAFVKWYGLRLLEPELRRLRLRDAPFRVITTTYLGATDRPALDRLVNDFGADVKIQYDVLRTRLHAKAWLFRRETSFDTAYVGSSNLSRAALLDGVEWNVRLSRIATPGLLNKFGATFDTYWNDSTFESYDPARDREPPRRCTRRSWQPQGIRSSHDLPRRPRSTSAAVSAEMLEEIEVEREVHTRHRNLVVAATGTGKTVIAALDYRRLRDAAISVVSLPLIAVCRSSEKRSSSNPSAPTAKFSPMPASARSITRARAPSGGGTSLRRCKPSMRTTSRRCQRTPSRLSSSTSSITPLRPRIADFSTTSSLVNC